MQIGAWVTLENYISIQYSIDPPNELATFIFESPGHPDFTLVASIGALRCCSESFASALNDLTKAIASNEQTDD